MPSADRRLVATRPYFSELRGNPAEFQQAEGYVHTLALTIARELCGLAEINLLMIGGMPRCITRSFAGPQAQKLLADLRVDHFSPGVDGLEPGIGPSTPLSSRRS